MDPHDPVGPAPDLAAEVIRLRAEIAGLIEANALLVVRLENARGMGQQLVDDGECGYEITQRWLIWPKDEPDDLTPALGWMAAREAAAETVRAILVRDGDHTQARQPECADKMFKYAEELPAAIRALPAPTSAQLLAEAVNLPEIAAQLAAADRLAALVADEEMPDWQVGEGRANEINTHDWMGIRAALAAYRAIRGGGNG